MGIGTLPTSIDKIRLDNIITKLKKFERKMDIFSKDKTI